MQTMRDYRKAKHMTMKELGDKVGCSESAISLYELGKRQPDYETLLKIAEELDTTVETLIRGNDVVPIQTISPAKQELLDLVDDLTDEQAKKVMEIIQIALKL